MFCSWMVWQGALSVSCAQASATSMELQDLDALIKHVGQLRFISFHMVSLGVTWTHWFHTWSRSVSLGLPWFHLVSLVLIGFILGLTWFHFVLLGFIWFSLDSLGFTWFQLVSLGFIWSDDGLTSLHVGLTHSEKH